VIVAGARLAAARAGFVASLALVPSVFVYGTVFGGLAVQAGLRPLEVWGMSLLVFAGASQFVAVPMLAAGASPLAIVLTTYVINMRHYLMAATLAPAFCGFPRRWLALVAHWINDESFAIAVARRNPPDPWFYLGSAAAVGGSFLGGVPVGTQLGDWSPSPRAGASTSPFPPSSWPSSRCSSGGGRTGWWRWRAGRSRSPSRSPCRATGTSSSPA